MYRIGVDIGGTGIQAGLVDEKGKIIGQKECYTRTQAGFRRIIEEIRELVIELLHTYHQTIHKPY